MSTTFRGQWKRRVALSLLAFEGCRPLCFQTAAGNAVACSQLPPVIPFLRAALAGAEVLDVAELIVAGIARHGEPAVFLPRFDDRGSAFF